MENRLLVNAIITPDGTVLHSKHRHDYVEHLDANGETYMLDGGTNYVRRSVNNEAAVNMCLYSNDPHEALREWFVWGTKGENGDQSIAWVKLKNMTDKHIAAVLATQTELASHIKKLFKNEQIYRDKRDETAQ